MAVTKRLTCKFDMKIIYTSEDMEAYTKELVKMTKGYVSGEKWNGLTRKLVETAVEQGVEAAMEIHLKSILASKLKDELPEDGAVLSNISVRFQR